MKLTLEEKTKLIKLSERASDILVKIMDEKLPKEKTYTINDILFKGILLNIHEICPLLSDSYSIMYNYLQKQKISSKDNYFKQIKTSVGKNE